MFSRPDRSHCNADPTRLGTSLPGWLSPDTAAAMRVAMTETLAGGGSAEAACEAAIAIAMVRYPALSIALIRDAALELLPPD